MKNFNYLFFLFTLFVSHNLEAQNNALNFDGVDDYAQLSSTFDANDALNGDFTIEFWIKTNSLNEAVVMSKWNESTDGTFKIEMTNEGKIAFTCSSSSSGIQRMESDEIITNNGWNHVAISKGGGTFSSLYMYINAEQQSNYLFLFGDLTNTSYPLYVGKEESNSLTPFRGELDELRIWSENRSCPNIFANMLNQQFGSASNLRVQHSFNQGTAGGNNTTPNLINFLVDDSGNINNGTLFNFDLNNSTSNWVAATNGVNDVGFTLDTEINIRQSGGKTIRNGDTTPSFEDRTDFGLVYGNGDEDRYYVIENLGNNPLNLSNFPPISSSNPNFTVNYFSTPPSSIGTCGGEDFFITFNTSSVGIQESTITIISDDPNEPNYTFKIRAKAAAQIYLTGNSMEIFNSSSPNSLNGTDFDDVNKCETVRQVYEIKNIGGEVLEIYGDIQVSGNGAFKVINQPAATLPIGDSTTFEIEYTPTEESFQEATVYISSNANPFIFRIQALANTATYPDYEWQTVGNTGFSAENTNFHSLKIANGGTPYIAFQEGTNQITKVMRFDGASWQNVGTMPTTNQTAYQSLVIDNQNNLYVAYQNGANNNQTVILKYDGTNWTTLGNNISGNDNSYQKLAIDKAGKLYITFRNTTGKAKVMTYDTTTNTWENIGTDNSGFSEGDASYLDLAIDINNYLVVVFKDEANPNTANQGARVMFFENGEWLDFENLPDVTNPLEPTEQRIALNRDGEIYVAFQDASNLAQVYYYGESGWNPYGLGLPSNSTAIGNLIIGLDNRVYLCFQDQGNTNRATVKVNNFGSWEDVGDIGLAIDNINLALDKNGILYVAFSDLNNNGKTTVMHFLPNDDKPIIKLKGNNNPIANGSTTTNTTNNTNFGTIFNTKTITYTIENNGNLDLDIFSISSTGATEFAITSVPPNSFIPPSNSITFDVTFTNVSAGLRTATIEINNGDCGTPLYTFNVQAMGVTTPPSIEVAQSSVIINNGDNYNFGNILNCGNGTTKIYTITNRGADGLDVSTITQAGSPDFLVTGFTPSVLNFNQSTTFFVTFNSTISTVQTATIAINNSSINASPFTFSVSGASSGTDTQAPVLIPMPDFVRNTDATNCFYTNQPINTSQRIPNGTVIDNCNVVHNYILSGATTINTATSLEGIRFNRGITTVKWSATDESGNVSLSNEFVVRVSDAQNPIIQAPAAITRKTDLYSCEADSLGINLGMPIVSDNCRARAFNDAPAQFPVGETVVIWTAIDSAGNTATAEQIVTIEEQFFVSPSDSLILVDMYNQTGGQNWIRNWDLNAPVSTWSGISVSCAKIIRIDLSNNNLTGILPRSVLNLAQINAPNFSLAIGGNRLSFESAEDFVGLISNFTYSPQAKLYAPLRQIISEGESITFSSATEGDFNSYQWYKNQIRINGSTSPTITITNARVADAGIYVCEVKNSRATALILERQPITLTVEGFVNPTDSLALVRIFEETGGRTSWRTRWNLQDPVYTWEGITLSGNKVTEIDLSSFGMVGILPNVFDADLFSELRYLSFFDNELEGQIPPTMGSLSTLTYLDLDKNKFEGAVPATFGGLINLQALWLSRNNLTSLPNEIGNLRSLKTFYLNGNKFTTLPETIGNLSELLVLNVSDNQLIALPNSITNLQKLIEFYANRNFIVALPTGIQNLISLIAFEVNTNNLSSIPLDFLQMNTVEKLRIAENKLEFDDLLPFANSNFIVFDYAPQAPINEEIDILIPTNSSFSFSISTQGNGNRYQWLKDGNPVSTLQNFTINRVINRDAGLYTAFITNASLPNLTLERRSVRLNIECQTGLNFQILQPQQNKFCENQPFTLKLAINDEFIATSQIRWRKDGIIVAFANQNNYTVTEAGIYTAEIITTNGCTAISNQIDIITTPEVEVVISLENEDILKSTINSQEAVTYQWLKDGNPIENGFESTYTPTQTGEYSLSILTESGCSSISQTIIFTTDQITGIEEPKELRELVLFPNPNKGTFFIDFGTNSPNGEVIFTLIDAIGRQLNIKTQKISSTRYDVQTTNFAGGIYQLQIQTKDGIAFRKFVIEE